MYIFGLSKQIMQKLCNFAITDIEIIFSAGSHWLNELYRFFCHLANFVIDSVLILFIIVTLLISGPPRKARSPRPWSCLDFKKYNTMLEVAARWWSGRHYGGLVCQKTTGATLTVKVTQHLKTIHTVWRLNFPNPQLY